MKIETIMELYEKERLYQEKVFGDYENNPALNVASFLNFIEMYLEKAKKSYAEPWTHYEKFPEWFTTCKEHSTQDMAPVKTYEYLIKIMVLAGAALEAYSELDPDFWREDNKPKEKWTR